MDVDLEGTEAAAATAISFGCSTGTPPVDLSLHVDVDRPFVVAIIDRPTKTLLFLGHVVRPTQYVTPPPPPPRPVSNTSSGASGTCN